MTDKDLTNTPQLDNLYSMGTSNYVLTDATDIIRNGTSYISNIGADSEFFSSIATTFSEWHGDEE